jgi:MFS family permease
VLGVGLEPTCLAALAPKASASAISPPQPAPRRANPSLAFLNDILNVMKIHVNVDVKVGRIVKYFIISDLFLLGGWGFIDPIFSVFVVQNVVGATLATLGIGAGIYWTLRSLLQIPIGIYLDRTPGEKDDFIALIIGLFLAGFSALAFGFVTTVWEFYVVQIIHAGAFALYFASWPTIFSRHLDKDKVSFDWSLDSTVVGVAAAIAGLLGGIVANSYGYVFVFMAAAILSFVSAFVLMAVPDLMIPKPTQAAMPKDHTPENLGPGNLGV